MVNNQGVKPRNRWVIEAQRHLHKTHRLSALNRQSIVLGNAGNQQEAKTRMVTDCLKPGYTQLSL